MPPAMWSILVSISCSFRCTMTCSEATYTSLHTFVQQFLSMARKYELKKRAERQEETRRRIVEAAIHLHRTKGPARTTFSDIAALAGVQRHTLYRYFPDERQMGLACSGHHFELNPPPDAAQ